MTLRPLRPQGLKGDLAGLAPGVVAGGLVFVTGMTGAGPDGAMPDSVAAQTRAPFAKIAAVLAEANASLSDIVDLTTFHVDIDEHFTSFDAIRRDVLANAAPAWTAVGVTALRRQGALVEVKAVAVVRQSGP